jgi:ethanolamine utilization protein EutA (predicted chaperonin)
VVHANTKCVTMVDVTVPFENRPVAFIIARQNKLDAYSDLKQQLERDGWKVQLDAFIVGSLGGWGLANEKVLQQLKINASYARVMPSLM